MKLAIILSKLQKAKGKGVKEIDVLTDWETKGNARVIKYRLNKIADVTVKNGRWYLSEHYWSMTKTEFSENMWREAVKEISFRNNLVTIIVVVIFTTLFLLLTVELEFIWL